MTDLDNGADLRERFDHAMSDLAAPDHLTEGALTVGRRLRRRRRVVAGGAGLVTAAAVTAVVVATLGGGAPRADLDIATQPPAPKSSEKPLTGPPSLAPDGPTAPFPDPPEGWWDAPADQLLEQLEDALPEGVVVTDSELAPSDRAPGEPAVSDGWLSATLDGPDGPGGFEVILYMPDLEEDPGPVVSTDAEGNEQTQILLTGPSNQRQIRCDRAGYADTCRQLTSADGTRIGRVTSNLQDGVITFYEISLLGPEGGRIYMSAWNATDGKPGPDTVPSATAPPLTLEQLQVLAEDPLWTSYTP